MTAAPPAPGSAAAPKGRIRRGNERAILKAAERVFAERGFAGATMGDIAAQARLPKANVHYYFGTKDELYRSVLDDILDEWLTPVDDIHPDSDPATALRRYVEAKMKASRTRPHASKVFANEIIHGADVIADVLSNDLRERVDAKAAVFAAWTRQGRIAPVDPRHALFMIWAITQHYADFDVQVRAVLNKRGLSREDWAHITDQVTAFILRGFGLPADGGRAPGDSPSRSPSPSPPQQHTKE
jgi:TetR/AcrR family transcriptional regulator